MGKFQEIKLTVDVVCFCRIEGRLHTLLIKRAFEPYKNCWAFPGGFVEDHEKLQDAALRELHEETGVKEIHLEQLATFGDPGRDPRGRVVSVVYLAFLPSTPALQSGDDAHAAQWVPIENLPPLAFDHEDILKCALAKLNSDLST